MAFPVTGKTALITGAGNGICLELTKLLLKKQCSVVLVDLLLSPEAEELVQTQAAHAKFIQTDVTVWEQLERAFDFAVKEFGGLDIVVPGAGVFEPEWSSFWHPSKASPKTQPSTFLTLEVNITHPIKTTQLAISTFQSLPSKKGTIILISSIAAQMPLFPYPLYAASKAAISSFVRSLAPLEPTIGVRVAAVAPGIVRTKLWTEEKLSLVDDAEGKDEWVSAERVAEVMVELMEEEKWEAGSVVEVGVEENRLVKGCGDEGPTGKGCVVSGDPGVAVGAALKGIKEEFIR